MTAHFRAHSLWCFPIGYVVLGTGTAAYRDTDTAAVPSCRREEIHITQSSVRERDYSQHQTLRITPEAAVLPNHPPVSLFSPVSEVPAVSATTRRP